MTRFTTNIDHVIEHYHSRPEWNSPENIHFHFSIYLKSTYPNRTEMASDNLEDMYDMKVLEGLPPRYSLESLPSYSYERPGSSSSDAITIPSVLTGDFTLEVINEGIVSLDSKPWQATRRHTLSVAQEICSMATRVPDEMKAKFANNPRLRDSLRMEQIKSRAQQVLEWLEDFEDFASLDLKPETFEVFDRAMKRLVWEIAGVIQFMESNIRPWTEESEVQPPEIVPEDMIKSFEKFHSLWTDPQFAK